MKKIITISVFAIVAILGITVATCYIKYNNKEISLRQQSSAQRGKIESTHDKMWKIIKQKVQVTDEYKNAFEEIYPQLIEGRYSQGDGSLMKWIQESNPNFDTSLYKDLMMSIEIERNSFHTAQSQMLDIIREHTTLINSIPARWFISCDMPIEYTVISSTKTKAVMQLGMDDEVDIFDKEK